MVLQPLGNRNLFPRPKTEVPDRRTSAGDEQAAIEWMYLKLPKLNYELWRANKVRDVLCDHFLFAIE